ncbi:diaminopimelate decarboxylase [Lentzea albidocapillata subsp. violacea]|uniref:Diaminopimelate decarboxylase n=1 Tax=Lentzea albidocapillata subsp. violacea TaxID=128104 RepID=A0A1G9XT30_9PSEU|nr:hypothetical protein [Lentzea albidocapillata]SDM99972.1 diaminopimelate decarboxylase [Lentzea albidocapillata subsp. violacea]
MSLQRWQTPAYVYRLDRIHAAHAALRAALPGPSDLFYSLKANPHPDLVRALAGMGCRAEISSPGELRNALDGGARPQDCLYTGPGKTTAEIAYALDGGVRRFSVESIGQLAALSDVATAKSIEVSCLLRVRAEPGSGSLTMSGRRSPFGIGLAYLLAHFSEFMHDQNVSVEGLHFFPVSAAADEPSLISSFETSVVAAQRVRDETGWEPSLLDLGGGFAAPYGVPGGLPVYPALRDRLEALLDEAFPHWRSGSPRIAFESGRYLVGTCGELQCAVTDIKSDGAATVVVLDAGINHLGGLSGLGKLLPLRTQPQRLEGTGETEADSEPVDVVGPLCTPADLLAKNVRIPNLSTGDVLRIPNVGAYGLTASLVGFLGRDLPLEVVLDGPDVISISTLSLQRHPVVLNGENR